MRRRKTKSKDWLGFRIDSVLGKHIAHRCLLDKREVAIADGVVAVTEGDIKTRTFVSAYLDLVIYKNIAIFALLL